MLDSMVGITARDWFQLVKDNNFKIALRYWYEISLVTILSLINSKSRIKEIKRFGKSVKQTEIKKAPIFIIGHWRSGTTFLHNLLSLDEQFAYAHLFEVNNPHTFLTKTELVDRKYANHGDYKRVMDNIKVSLYSPSEEEFGVAILTLKSPLLGWVFPKRAEYYDRYLTFQDISQEEIDQWKKGFLLYLKKLTLKYDKQLLLKSPANTGRIRLLLEMFPKAKFIHIHRNPYHVFQSTKKMYKTAVTHSQFQYPDSEEIDDYIIGGYKKLYEAFFADRELIPEDQFIEVAFEDLESNPLPVVQKIYDHLSIKGFKEMKPDLEEFIQAHSNYKKNIYTEIKGKLQNNIQKKWKRCFDEWGYTL